MINLRFRVVSRYSAGLLVPLAFVWSSASASSQENIRADVQDPSLVYCLAPHHGTELVDAAVALNLAIHGNTPDELRLTANGPSITPSGWLKDRPADFARACNALIKADAPVATAPSNTGASKLTSLVAVLLPVITGALLTFLVSEWRAARDRAKTRSGTLRAAMGSLRSTGFEYGRSLAQASVGSLPNIGDFERSMLNLESELTRLQAFHQRWTFVGELRAVVTQRLGGELQPMTAGDSTARRQKELDLRSLLELIEADVERVALALEKPRPYHKSMSSGQSSSASRNYGISIKSRRS